MNKKSIIGIFLGLLSISGGLALWTTFFTGSSILTISSEHPVTYVSELDTNLVDVSEAGATVTDKITIHNGNLDILYVPATWVVTVTDYELDSCTPGENEVQVTLLNDEIPMEQGYVIEVGPSQSREVFVKYQIPELACPGEVMVDLTLSPT